MKGPWSVGVLVSSQVVDLPRATTNPNMADLVTAESLRGALTLARSFAVETVTIGVGVRTGQLEVSSSAEGSLFTLQGVSLEGGVNVRPHQQRYRVGAAVALPVRGDDVTASNCDPNACNGFILPNRVEVPAQVVFGAAVRLAKTPWNIKLASDYRDERSLTLALDVLLSAPVSGGVSLAGFADGQEQRSGRRMSVGVRTGAEVEAIPGRLRLRAGSYWEPGRVEGMAGRLHGTAGLEARAFAFRFWGPRRVRVSLTGDVARQFLNAGVSLGFWH